MDIALRKDLIGIQELIANPPPKSTHHHRTNSHHQLPAGEPEDVQVAANEAGLTNSNRLYSQLYASSRVNLLSSKPPRGQHRRRHCKAHHHHHNHHQYNSRRQHVVASRFLCSSPPVSRGSSRQAEAPIERTRRRVSELELSNAMGDQLRLISRSEAHLNEANVGLRSRLLVKRRNLAAAGRTKTLIGGADLLDLRQPDRRPVRPSSAGSLRSPLDDAKDQVYAPDLILGATKMDLRLQDKPPVIESKQSNSASKEGEPHARRANRSLASSKATSPSGSFRSSSRLGGGGGAKVGRLIVQRSSLGQPVATATSGQKRANLATLLQLRSMVNLNTSRKQQQQQVAKSHSELPIKLNNNEKSIKLEEESSQTNSGAEQKPLVVVVGGRRQERLMALKGSPEEAKQVAPNGSRLVRTRPLAALDDDTQLYAIPKKITLKVSCAFGLVQIDFELSIHSSAGRQVKFVCFNKVSLPACCGSIVCRVVDISRPEASRLMSKWAATGEILSTCWSY